MKRRSKPLSIEIIDDNQTFLDDCRERLTKSAPKGTVEIHETGVDDIRTSVKALDDVRRNARKQDAVPFDASKSPYSGIDIVFVDYDLLELEETTSLTGEDIAYLLRCFSASGIVVLLNPPDLGTEFFDLRLRRSMDSWADFVLGSDQLGNTWLWSNEPSGFAPWSWPQLGETVARRHKQIKSLSGNLDQPVLDLLEFPEFARIAMDHAMSAVVTHRSRTEQSGPTSIKPRTVRELVLDSGYGLHRRDATGVKEQDPQLCRIAAARIAYWLEHVVLPAQSVLIDAPHLVSRLPGLMAADPSKLASWNALSSRFELDPHTLRGSQIKDYRFKCQEWLSRPAWFWPQILSNEQYFEWAQPIGLTDLVFCEDTSIFSKRSTAKEFMADVPGQTALRYVQIPKPTAHHEKVTYRPSVRLSM